MPVVTPNGSDPIKYAAKFVQDLATVSDSKLKRIGDKLLQEIHIRTNDSMSFTGEEFTPYAPSTERKKGFPEPNLRSNDGGDHMMDELEVRISNDPIVIEIGIWSKGDKASVAQIQNEGSHRRLTFMRAGKIVEQSRRRPIRGLSFKGGRMIFDNRKILKAIERRSTVTVSKRVKKWVDRINEDTGKLQEFSVGPKRGAFKAPASVVEQNQRIFVRRRKMSVWEKSTFEKVEKIHVQTGVQRVPMYRVPMKQTLPARPFLGFSEDDLNFVGRNIVMKEENSESL